MRRPPRRPDAPLLGRRALLTALAKGAWAALLLAAGYGAALARLPEDQARGAAFAALILCSLGLLLAHRRDGRLVAALKVVNPVFVAIAAGALATLAAVLYVAPLAALFRVGAPPPAWLALALLAAAAMLSGLRLMRPFEETS